MSIHEATQTAVPTYPLARGRSLFRDLDRPADAGGQRELISLVSERAQVLSIANFAVGHAGARVTGGSADSRPVEALAQIADLLAQNKLVIKVQTFPFGRAAEAYRISQGGHVRGKLVLIP